MESPDIKCIENYSQINYIDNEYQVSNKFENDRKKKKREEIKFSDLELDFKNLKSILKNKAI